MHISTKGITLIKLYEGFSSTAYYCPAKVLTIGYGYTKGVEKNMVISEGTSISLLKSELIHYEDVIDKSVNVPLNQGQFDALVSLVYNIGSGAFRSSTLLKKLNKRNYKGAADEFLRWNKVSGRPLLGLTRRRKSERDLYLGK